MPGSTSTGGLYPEFRYRVSCDDVLSVRISHKKTNCGELVADPVWAAWRMIEASSPEYAISNRRA